MTSTTLPEHASRSAGALRAVLVAFAAVAGLLGVGYAIDVALAAGELPRGTVVGGVELGGKTRAEAAKLLEARIGPKASAPIPVVAADVRGSIDPKAAGLSFDVEATLDAVSRGSLNPVNRVRSVFTTTETPLVAEVDVEKLRAAVATFARRSVNRPAREGAVTFEGVKPVAVLPQPGRTLHANTSADRIAAAYLHRSAPVELDTVVTPVKSTAGAVEQAVTDIAVPAVSGPVSLVAGPRRVVVTPAEIAKVLSIKADDTGAIVATVDPKRLDAAVGARLTVVETPARDADFQLVDNKVRITPSATGTQVDFTALARDVVPVLRERAPREVALTIVPAEPELSTERARQLGIKEPIGTFTTYHPCCKPRVRNIHLMADIVDGAVVLPGETFSLNGYVGERDRARGFVRAPMILNGRFVDAVGGGVSQFATTMYNAVFFSGLQDVYHKAHSYYISRYPAGREATVSSPSPDLKWRNDSPYGVLVKTSYTDKSITVTFWSTKRYDIESISGPRTRVRGYPTRYEYGRGCSGMGGAAGFDIVVWRVFKQNGQEIKRERIFTRYLPEPRIICRASRSASPSPRPSASPSPAPSPSG